MTDYSLWERLARKNELKARGTFLIALPDKHQLKFNIHKNAKTLMEAIEKRFGGNKETKKVHKTLLKQQYENFTDSSSESLDQIHDRLQKLISQLEILRESLSQEDVNLKFLRSLPTEWRTHTLSWRNKTNLEEQSLDDLFNSLKIYAAEVKSSSSTSTSTQNISFVSSSNTDSTNKPVSVVASVAAVSAKILVFALPNIDADDLEEMGLKCLMAMLTVRERRFLQRTRRNLRENGPTSMGFDMSNVECYNCYMKGHFIRECRSPKDTRKNGVAEPPVETSISKALVSQCDGVGSYDWSFQVEEEPTNYALMAFTSSSSSSCDNEVVSCSKACTKAYATLQSHYDKLTDDFRKSQFDVISYKTGLESVEARLLVYQQNKTVFEEDIKLLKPEVQLRDNALVVLRQKLEKAEQERDDLKLKLEKFQTSSKNLSQLLASQTNDKTRLGYNTQVFTHSMFDCDDYFTSKSDESLPPSPIYDRPSTPIIEDWVFDSEDDSEAETSHNTPSFVQPTEQVKTPRPSVKSVETSILTANTKTVIPKPKSNGNHRNRKACFVCKSLDHLIKDLILTKSKLVPITAARPVTAAVLKSHVTRPRPPNPIITKPHSPPRRHINRSPSHKTSNFPPKVTTVKVPQGNPQHALKDKGIIDSGCSRNMTGNMFYLSDFEELNCGYVVFGGNPKGGKISGKDENQVLLRVPRENNMYNVNLKNIVPSGDLTCLFANSTLDESNLWHRRLGHINFKTMNKLVKDSLGKFDGKVDEGFLVGYSVSSKAFRVFNSRNQIVQETLHINFLENRPNVAGSGPTWLFDIDTLIKIMNYQPVIVGNQSNPSAGIQEQFDTEKAGEESVQQYVLFPVWSSVSTNPHNTNGDAAFEVKEPEFEGRKPQSKVHVSPSGFEDFSNNSINEDNVTGSLVPAVRKISTNNTNTFSVAGPSNAFVSPTHGKSSNVDFSQLPGDPNMPELEDITYSEDEDDVGAEANFNNLETTITVSPILTTRVHKDHHVTQIIGDLSSATQTKKEPKRVHQVVKDPSWIEAMQEELLQFKIQKREKIDQTLFIKRQKGDILLIQIYVDDIIFGSTNKDICKAFEKLMKDKFQMSSMGELTFFLGLPVKQKKDRIFISQDKYVAEIIRKFGLTDGKSASIVTSRSDRETKGYVIMSHQNILNASERLYY
nr:hypothetical protein [Tanacetum cinerariifolium]